MAEKENCLWGRIVCHGQLRQEEGDGSVASKGNRPPDRTAVPDQIREGLGEMYTGGGKVSDALYNLLNDANPPPSQKQGQAWPSPAKK